ncbi:hypothetical protein QOZ80_2AG0105490 [Eleusine coracana subsp. coracana]|nr:hypothetical protein QOZ80_2AG0105490 [Eleusine coracana subsp. coracana]
MDRRNRAPLVDSSSSCLCRAEKSSAACAAARRVPLPRACAQPSVKASIHPLKPKTSPRRKADRCRDVQRPLLPGLPDDLAIACLIRVPRADHCRLRLVCQRWARLLAGNYLYGLRRRLGLAEPWLYAVRRDPRDGRVTWHALDPAASSSSPSWRALPPVPREYAGADGFACAALGGCHLYLLGGRDPRASGGGGSTRRVVFYSARSNRWHRAPDMLRRRRCFAACVMGGRLYVAGGEGGVRSAEAFDPGKNRWCVVAEMAAPVVPSVSAVHGGRWYVKGVGPQQQVVSQVYSPEADAWSVVLDGMVTGWKGPTACLHDGGGRLYAADCKDGCRLRVYDQAADAWTVCVDSGLHRGRSQAVEASAIVALGNRLCVVRNDMTVLAVDVDPGTGNQRWETLAGKSNVKNFVADIWSNIAGRGRAKSSILHCQVLEA